MDHLWTPIEIINKDVFCCVASVGVDALSQSGTPTSVASSCAFLNVPQTGVAHEITKGN